MDYGLKETLPTLFLVDADNKTIYTSGRPNETLPPSGWCARGFNTTFRALISLRNLMGKDRMAKAFWSDIKAHVVALTGETPPADQFKMMCNYIASMEDGTVGTAAKYC